MIGLSPPTRPPHQCGHQCTIGRVCLQRLSGTAGRRGLLRRERSERAGGTCSAPDVPGDASCVVHPVPSQSARCLNKRLGVREAGAGRSLAACWRLSPRSARAASLQGRRRHERRAARPQAGRLPLLSAALGRRLSPARPAGRPRRSPCAAHTGSPPGCAGRRRADAPIPGGGAAAAPRSGPIGRPSAASRSSPCFGDSAASACSTHAASLRAPRR